ncbi:MAG: biotin/lipoyl-binding protein [Proteobacteria bacterium]|nr:biotin/lipoyl-binding protein [Pseudomonadota bacterium]
MEYRLKIEEDTTPIEVDVGNGDNLTVSIDSETFDVDYSLVSENQIHLTVDGKGVNAFVADGPEGKSVLIDGVAYLVQDADALERRSTKKRGNQNLPTEITPVTPSVVVSVLVKEGDELQKGQGVIVLSAMKMETTLTAPFDGKVTGINVAEGDKVAPGLILVDIDETVKDVA